MQSEDKNIARDVKGRVPLKYVRACLETSATVRREGCKGETPQVFFHIPCALVAARHAWSNFSRTWNFRWAT
jgi:hypothetical protein